MPYPRRYRRRRPRRTRRIPGIATRPRMMPNIAESDSIPTLAGKSLTLIANTLYWS